ncbi:MAG TPA: hypothetical protein VFV99_25770 [Kofleriaceae bacterium]|nr:hypothetical protein [Kofleriaceae bacterium]
MIEVAGLTVHQDVVEHPLLGDAHIIEHAGEPITAMSAIDWDRPTRIPTVAEPRALPRGTGSMLINEIASRAQRAGVQALRYAGPYPTPALFNTLKRSFRTTATESIFSSDVLGRAMRLARDEVPVDFVPAPFTRQPMPYGSIDVRDGIERAVINGILFDQEPTVGSLARLVGIEAPIGSTASGAAAVLAFDTVVWTHVAELATDGSLVGDVRPIPALDSNVIGKQFPAELKQIFSEFVASSDAIPGPLCRDTERVLSERLITWRDLGWRAAAREGDGFALHVGWWTHLVPRGFETLVRALADAIAPVAVQLILDEVTR